MVIRVRDPFATLLGLQRAMESVMGSDWFGSRTSGSGAFPLLNVFTDGDDFVVEAELARRQEARSRRPGSRRHAADPRQKDDCIRRDREIDRRERAAGQFDRTVTLPDEIDSAKVSVDFRDGVLTLRLPRCREREAAHGRHQLTVN